jgi:Flp pilus assembly protein TadD
MTKVDALLSNALARRPAVGDATETEQAAFATMLAMLRKICTSLHATLVFAGDHDGVAEILEKYLELDESCWELRAKLGESYVALGNFAAALPHLRKVRDQRPDFAPIYFTLGIALAKTGRATEARDALEQAYSLDPDSVAVANNLANCLLDAGEHRRARAIIERALERHPQVSQLLWVLAQAAQQGGDFQASQTALETFLSLNPDHGEAYRSLGLQTRFAHDDPRLNAMRQAYERSPADGQNQVSLGFALFRAHDQLMDFQAAWSYLDIANQARRSLAPFDMAREFERFGALETFYTPEVFERFAGTGRMESGPVFIVGLPRSGTSLTEQIIACHPDVHGAGELDLLHTLNGRARLPGSAEGAIGNASRVAPDVFRAIGEIYLDQLGKLAGTARVHTDKMPVNFMLLGLIRLALPNARIIHCRREPLANCFSLYTSYLPSRAQGYSFDLREIGQYYLGYSRLMAHWQALMGDAIYTLDHDTLIADQEGETRRLLDFIGLDFHLACLDFHRSERAVRTLSSTQVRQGLDKGTNDKVLNYLGHLGPLIRTLRDGGITLPAATVGIV